MGKWPKGRKSCERTGKKQMKRKEDKNRGTIKEKGREFYKLENTATRDVSNLLETEKEEENKD